MKESVDINDTGPSWLNVKFHYFTNGTLLRRFYRSYVEGLKLQGNEKVLDFGSGTGAEAVHIAEILAKGGGRVTCLDIWPAWLESAKKRLRKYENADFLLGDITMLKIEEGSFDAVVIHFVLHDISRGERPEIIRALARALKSGGRLFIREPLDKNHGIPAEDIRSLMNDGGLRESGFKFSKSFFSGAMFEAVYEK